MGLRRSIALCALLAAEAPAAADHYDDLRFRIDAPAGAPLHRDGSQISADTTVDGVATTVRVVLVDGDWSRKAIAEMFQSASTIPDDVGRELDTGLRTLHAHLVVSETWEAKDQDLRFETVLFPTAKALYLISYSTPKADFDRSRAARNAFFRNAVSFDDGPPGAELADTPLLARLRSAASGPGAFTGVADAKVKVVVTDTHKTKQISRSKVDQALWDAELAALFAELAAGGDAACDDDKLACKLIDPAGPAVEYRFKNSKGAARLSEIRTTSGS